MQRNETVNALPIAVILTAIPVEYQAIKAHLTNIEEDVSDDGTIFEKGELQWDGQGWIVVIRETEAGNVNATHAVHITWEKYRPDVMIFCGIAGGIKDVKIGDIVVASKVYNYHSGKRDPNFSARPETYYPSSAIMERANLEAQNFNNINVLVKPIASGEEVVASKESETHKIILEHYSDAIAIDMEGYGFLSTAVRLSVSERLLIRGISDLLDDKAETDKHGSQLLAARNAAAFTFQVLKKFIIPRSKIARSNLPEVKAPEKISETAKDENTLIENHSERKSKIPELTVVDRFRSELKEKGIHGIGIEERVRLFVFAGSILPHNVKFNELDNHLLHKMYLYRSSLNLTSHEQYLIYTTLLRDSWNYKVGWFWLRNVPSTRIVESLEEVAISADVDDKSREGAIRILQTLEPTKAENSLSKIVKKCEHAQKRNILDYLCLHGSRKSLDVVDKLTAGEHEGVTSKAILAKIWILSRHEPEQAVRIMIEESQKDPKILGEASLEKIVSMMSTRNLRKLAANNFLCALKELAKRGKATEVELSMMLEANVPEIRFWGYSGLLKQGFKFDPGEIQDKWPKSWARGVWGFLGTYYEIQGVNWLSKTLLEVYLKMPITELERSVELKRQRGVVYLAWGLSGGRSVVENIRNDLRNNFERHKVNLLVKIEETKGDTEEIQRARESLQKIENSLTIELTVSALKVLEKYGKAGDKIIAKKFLKSDDVQVRASAVNLFAKYAGKRDIDVLLEIVKDGDTEGRITAAKRILKLNTSEQHIRDLLESNYSNVVKEVLCWHITNKEKLNWGDISILFYSKNDEIRLLTTAYATKTWNRQQLELLLKKYLSSETYYYDVVCWLDRILYAPRNLSQGYKKKLIEKFD